MNFSFDTKIADPQVCYFPFLLISCKCYIPYQRDRFYLASLTDGFSPRYRFAQS
jgi:hypothetical protein